MFQNNKIKCEDVKVVSDVDVPTLPQEESNTDELDLVKNLTNREDVIYYLISHEGYRCQHDMSKEANKIWLNSLPLDELQYVRDSIEVCEYREQEASLKDELKSYLRYIDAIFENKHCHDFATYFTGGVMSHPALM